MLSELLMILKIIGIILLVILGIIFILLLTILFSPIKYKGHITYEETLYGEILVTWIVAFFHVNGVFKDNIFKYKVNVFGGTIFTNDEDIRLSLLGRIISNRMNKEDTSTTDDTKDVPDDDATNDDATNDDATNDNATNDNVTNENVADENVADENTNLLEEKSLDDSSDPDEEENLKFLDILHEFLDNIKQIVSNIITSLKRAKTFKEKIEIIIAFLKKESTKKAFKDGSSYVKLLLKHILPRKLFGYANFGFDDPSTTGQVLGIIALFMPIYKDNIRMIPDFENQLFKCDLTAKGRIRISYILKIVLKVIRDKNLISSVKKMSKLLGGD